MKQILEVKNALNRKKSQWGFRSRLDQAEERNSKLEGKSFKIIQSEMQKIKKIKKNEEWRKPKGFMRHQILWVPEGERRKGQKAYFKKLVENLSNLGKELDIQIHEYPWTLKIEHIETNIIKLLKFKDRERLLKIAREVI